MNVSWIQPNITQADPSVCNFTTAVLSWDPALKLDQNRNRCRPIKYQIQYGLAKQDTAIFQDLVQSIDNQSLDLPVSHIPILSLTDHLRITNRLF